MQAAAFKVLALADVPDTRFVYVEDLLRKMVKDKAATIRALLSEKLSCVGSKDEEDLQDVDWRTANRLIELMGAISRVETASRRCRVRRLRRWPRR